MPVFNIAANTKIARPVDAYYEGKALRAKTDLVEKQTSLLDDELNIERQKANTASGNLNMRVKEYLSKVKKDEAELLRNAMAAGIAAEEKSGDPQEGWKATVSALDSAIEGDIDEVFKQYPELDRDGGSWDRETAEAIVITADELLKQRAEKPYSQADFIDPSGRATQGTFNAKTGEYGSTPHAPIAPQAGQDDIGGLSNAGVNATTVAFRQKVVQAATGAKSATEMVKISYRSPAAMAKSGAIITFGNEVYKTAKNLVEVVGRPELPASETEKQRQGVTAFDWSGVDKQITKLGLLPSDAANMRSGLYSLAFSAAVGEQGSRPSDKDIQAYIEIYGGGITDAKAFRSTIGMAMRRQYNMLKFTADANPEITNSAAALAVFEAPYKEFLQALGSDVAGTTDGNTVTYDDGTRVVFK
jgi:hypothetical protein